MNLLKPSLLIIALTPAFILTGCLTSRTVSENGVVKEQNYVIKRPVKNLINNTTFE